MVSLCSLDFPSSRTWSTTMEPPAFSALRILAVIVVIYCARIAFVHDICCSGVMGGSPVSAAGALGGSCIGLSAYIFFILL